LPNEQARLDILKIHSGPIAKRGDMGKQQQKNSISCFLRD